MDIRPFFVMLDNTWVANVIKDSRWWFPVIETVHVLGFSALMGSTFLVDMHFFGLSMNKQPVHRIARQLWPATMWALLVTVTTGLLMVTGEAIKCLENQAFWPKMVFFVLAVTFQMTLHKRLTMDENAAPSPGMGRLIGVVSVLLWSAIFVAGRSIGFV